MDYQDVCVLVAAMNEEEGIGLTLDEVQQVLGNPNFVVVDGNSTDKTAEIARNYGLVTYQKGAGKGDAIAQGINLVTGDPNYLILIDADYTYPAAYLKEMINVLETCSEVGMVIGNRFSSMIKPTSIRNPYYTGNRFLALAQYLLNGVKLEDPLSGLRVIRWELMKDWIPKSKGFDIEAELNHRIERLGYHIQEIPIIYRPRLGEKKLTYSDGFSILKRIIQESITSNLLRLNI